MPSDHKLFIYLLQANALIAFQDPPKVLFSDHTRSSHGQGCHYLSHDETP